MSRPPSELSFFARLSLATSCFVRILTQASIAQQAATWLRPAAPAPVSAAPVTPVAPAPAVPVVRLPEVVHASGLGLLAMLQREGRLIDFLQEDVSAFSDAEVGGAARVVHAGARKVLAQCLTLEPILKESEGAAVSVAPGFDAQRIRLTGNIAGQPPFRGTLKHHGWVATAVRLPEISPALDARILAPAEVEL